MDTPPLPSGRQEITLFQFREGGHIFRVYRCREGRGDWEQCWEIDGRAVTSSEYLAARNKVHPLGLA